MSPLHTGVIEAAKALSDKLETCRRILANSSDWGPVGYRMALRGDFDDEPEMLRLMAAYEEGMKRA